MRRNFPSTAGRSRSIIDRVASNLSEIFNPKPPQRLVPFKCSICSRAERSGSLTTVNWIHICSQDLCITSRSSQLEHSENFLHPNGLEDYAVACSCLYIPACMRWNSLSTERSSRSIIDRVASNLSEIFNPKPPQSLVPFKCSICSRAERSGSLTTVNLIHICSQDLCSTLQSSQLADSAMLSSSIRPGRLCCCLQLFVHPSLYEMEFLLHWRK